jgi:predicted methyltransferase
LTKNIERLEELYKLLISGDYLYNDTVSFLDFIKILKLMKKSRKLSSCFKKSHLEMESFLGILDFLRNVNIIKIIKNRQIRIQNDEILNIIFESPSEKRVFLKLLRKIPTKLSLIRPWNLMGRRNLLTLYDSDFKLNVKNFQLPCSVLSSFRRAIVILNNLHFLSQNLLFIGDDDLISILCKFIIPDLPITIIEIDGRITKLLNKIAKKHKFKDFHVYNLDFKEIKEFPEILEKKYSIIHLDPPYEVKELQVFLNNIILLLDDKISQIFLNGLFDHRSMIILNQFISENKFTISKFYKLINNYPFKPLDSIFLKHLKKQIKLENRMKFNKKDLKRFEFSSDLYQIEKSWLE